VLRDALGGTYGVQVETKASKIPETTYSVTINFSCDPRRTEELVKRLFTEIETLKARGPAEREANDAREALLRRHESDLAQNNRLVAELTERYELGEDVGEFFGLPAEYGKLTREAIQDAARRYLDTGNYVKVTLYPEKTESGAVGQESLLQQVMRLPRGRSAEGVLQPAQAW